MTQFGGEEATWREINDAGARYDQAQADAARELADARGFILVTDAPRPGGIAGAACSCHELNDREGCSLALAALDYTLQLLRQYGRPLDELRRFAAGEIDRL